MATFPASPESLPGPPENFPDPRRAVRGLPKALPRSGKSGARSRQACRRSGSPFPRSRRARRRPGSAFPASRQFSGSSVKPACNPGMLSGTPAKAARNRANSAEDSGRISAALSRAAGMAIMLRDEIILAEQSQGVPAMAKFPKAEPKIQSLIHEITGGLADPLGCLSQSAGRRQGSRKDARYVCRFLRDRQG
uniref:Uncharacterized protein n=1 Tax=Candidatus Kentrum sp. UNK TaxID=2126344 RepID=A0A451ATK2_9GAMM|nr:MAG: hypothetical protein BECKUNK1418G_GA0071005_107811 [Candidatus Kentron sp. UNK]VFK69388.1 MAG: hypothetical protein BECKUNK1418H_GA0071006_101318 [Candidatus Kentron sp. UNK]